MFLSQAMTCVLEDAWAVAHKELAELTVHGTLRRHPPTRFALLALLSGAVLAGWLGPTWMGTPVALLFWTAASALLASSVAVDSFAGERERHTLEALLATPLPARAILIGKVSAIVLYTWGLTVAGLVAAIVIGSAVARSGPPSSPVLAASVAMLFLCPLAALFVAGLGGLVCLYTVEVRRARWIVYPAVAACLLTMAAGSLAYTRVSSWPSSATSLTAMTAADTIRLTWLAGLFLFVLDMLLLALVAARFRRRHLIPH